MSELKKLIADKAISRAAFTEEETFFIFECIMGMSDISDAQIGAYLCATGGREITADELVGAARSMRKHVTQVDVGKYLFGVELLDTCGTGGTGLDTFNTSTASAFVVAASGQPVAKHGNRGATSRCGSADVLRELGIALEISSEKVAECVAEVGFGFMFAPQHHPATKRVVGIRKELGFRTIFNFLGPLVNPAGASLQVLGVSKQSMVSTMAEALLRLGSKRAVVVSGDDGLDEFTVTDRSLAAEIVGGEIQDHRVTPEDVGLKRSTLADIAGDDPVAAAKKLRGVLAGEKNACRDLVCFNAGAALLIAGKSESLVEGVQFAARLIDSGAALGVLERAIAFTNT